MIVVGNKADLSKTERAVSQQEGAALARDFGAEFLEVSVCFFFSFFVKKIFFQMACIFTQAKDNFKVRDAFEILVRKVISKKPDAGRLEGSGGVFGAGAANNS